MNAPSSPEAALVPIDDLDREIVGLATRINAVTCELLVLVRQFDERVGWLKWGFESCADWLHWRCDFSIVTAREKVRVAHALKTLPSIAAAFSDGALSYSKVRALTRVARRDNEDELIDFATRTTAARVEERCRELRCGSMESLDEARRAHACRSLRIHRDPGRGIMTITVELPLETGQLVEKAIDHARDSISFDTPDLVDDRWAARQADAIVTMANTYLCGGRNASGRASENYQVTVHVDQSALADGNGRAGLPIESVKRLCCGGDAIVMVEDEYGEPLSVGRLLLLCDRHHRLVHEGGFRVERDYQDRWYFKRPDGRAVPACGYLAADMLDDDVGDVSALLQNPPRGGLSVNVG